MFSIDIDGKSYEAKVTFYTAQLYELEFRSDMIQDLYGVQTADPTLDVEEDGDEARIVRIDFTKVKWGALAKVLWAALKTADESVPSFSEWTKSTSGLNLWLVQDQLGSEVADCFFRAGAAEEDDAQAE